MMKLLIVSLIMVILAPSCSTTSSDTPDSTFTAISVLDVQWEKLNPSRGDKSPQAATLWGERKNQQVPTGFLAKFVDGFSSPPHIHNATYRAVVISGFIHNDDPNANKMWMPTGSFWTQPKGEVHITAAKGENCIALVEIDRGPYLVLPEKEQFDSGERPINMVPTNIVWTNNSRLKGAEIAYLWGNLQNENGTFLKLPAEFKGTIHSESPIFRSVVITGGLSHRKVNFQLLPGSYFSSKDYFTHHVGTHEETILYIRTHGVYRVKAH